MLDDLKIVFQIFDSKEKRQLAFIFISILISGLIQIAGIVSIVPFISVATNPELIVTNKYLSSLSNSLSLSGQREFLLVLGGGSFFVLVVSNLVLGFNIWLTMRFLVRANQELSKKLLHFYLKQHYLYHLSRNSAKLIKNLVVENGRIINGVVMTVLNISSQYVNVVLIVGLLLLVKPILVLMAMLTLGGTYLLIYVTIRNKLSKIGAHNSQLFFERNQLASESLGGIKDLKVLGRTNYYLDRYAIVVDEIIQNNIYARTVSQLPRYFLETIAFGGILLIALYLISEGSQTELMPLLSLYAFAGYRLMPALQSIFQGHAALRNDLTVVKVLEEELKGYASNVTTIQLDNSSDKERGSGRLPFADRIEIEDVGFHYPGSESLALNKITFAIEAKSCVGFVGPSGAGKTTCVDLLLGLIEPERGEMFVDGIKIDQTNVRQWQNNIGYVPQSIYLADTTIAENIAFGIMQEQIDTKAVLNAAKMASLDDFIENELPDGYQTVIGERGVRLSGGQRQRIGIARALYHNPEVLVLDEATSALDTPTEQAIMDSIHNLSGQVTIIIIAHRISTIRECSMIFHMESGSIVECGTYEYLLENSESFRLLAKATPGDNTQK